jgi:probable rRNA maturation factor
VNTSEVAVAGMAAPRWKARLAAFCLRAMEEAGIEGWDLSVLLCADVIIRDLNARYRGRDRATDVLSFSQREGMRVARPGTQRLAGDLVISLEAARRGAAAAGTGEEDELKRLVVHGVLHLAGMDHGPGAGRAMFLRQRKLLATLAGERIMGNAGGGP